MIIAAQRRFIPYVILLKMRKGFFLDYANRLKRYPPSPKKYAFFLEFPLAYMGLNSLAKILQSLVERAFASVGKAPNEMALKRLFRLR